MAALATACGSSQGGGVPSDRVVHLDPRLVDGRSSAVVMSELDGTLESFDFRGLDALPESWRVTGGNLGGKGPHGGLIVRGGGVPPTAATLIMEWPLDAGIVNTVEVDLAMKTEARSLLYWTGAEPMAGNVARVSDAGVETVVFDLSNQAAWQGQLGGLLFKLSSDRSQPLELMQVRLLRRPFSMGESPGPHAVPAAGGLRGDGGLIRAGATSWRAWPVPLGGDLVVDVELPARARLDVRLRSMNAEASSCELLVEAQGGVESVVRWELGQPGGKWLPFHADLGGYSGQAVRLVFRAPGEANPAEVGVMLGAPVVYGQLPADRRPNVLLITLDTTRFDALGSSHVQGVREVVSTPFLDDLASRSFVFQDAWSAANVTQPSHASILTGTAVQDHSLTDNFGVLAEGNSTLAERFAAAGYQTFAVSSQPAIGPASGFGQGFDAFAPPTTARGNNGRLSMDLVDGWLGEFAEWGQRPFFLWLHFFDAHAPYNLPKGELERFEGATGQVQPPKLIQTANLPQAKDTPQSIAFLGKVNNKDHINFLYRAEVSYLDQLLGGLFANLERDGIAEHTMVVLTADHGEFLGERGNFYNHKGLFPETVKVPLMIHLPGQTTGGVVQARVSTIDLAPTLLTQLGLDGADSQRDLIALAEGRSLAPSRERVWFEHANALQVGCRDSDYYFILTLREGMHFGAEIDPKTGFARARTIPSGSVSLYDLKADPDLEHNLATERPELVERYRSLLAEYRATAKPVGSARRAMTSEQAAELDALGYTGD